MVDIHICCTVSALYWQGLKKVLICKTKFVLSFLPVPLDCPSPNSPLDQNKCSRHVGMNLMLFPCRQCERMNQNSNICFTHGQKDCLECFYKTPKGNEVPVLQEKEEEIQDCLLSLFEEPTCQDQAQTVQDLIKQQQQQQQHLKLNL